MMTIASPISESTSAPLSGVASPAPCDGEVLQRLIDAAVPGVVELPAGDYVMRDSLRLRSGIHLRAQGLTRLRRAPTSQTALSQITGYGLYELVVENADAFGPGTGMAITDSRGGGFGVTVARVVSRDANRLFIDRPAGRDLRPSDHAIVRSIFPIVAGYGIEHASVSGIVVEGDGTDSPLDGCRDAGIYLLGCRDVRITRVEVVRYSGDAISFQQCVDTYVDHCHLHHNSGHGLHPGSGSVRYVMRGNRIEANHNCGIFYCLRTTHSLCVDNQISGNAIGISIGEMDTDHLIQGNTIVDNVAEGILFRTPVAMGGDRVAVIDNRIHENGIRAGKPQISVAARTRDVIIEGNNLASSSGSPLIEVGSDCPRIGISGNRDDSDKDVTTRINANSPIDAQSVPTTSILSQVGPAALAANGARHLGVASLSIWTDRTLNGDPKTD
jgi:hypothetical protein